MRLIIESSDPQMSQANDPLAEKRGRISHSTDESVGVCKEKLEFEVEVLTH